MQKLTLTLSCNLEILLNMRQALGPSDLVIAFRAQRKYEVGRPAGRETFFLQKYQTAKRAQSAATRLIKSDSLCGDTPNHQPAGGSAEGVWVALHAFFKLAAINPACALF